MFEFNNHPGGVNKRFTKTLRNLLDYKDSARFVTKSTNKLQVEFYLCLFISNTNGHIYSRDIMDLNTLPSLSEL